MIRPSIITSKAADDHYNNIVAKHADLVMAYAGQKQRVDAYNQQKQAAMQARNDMQAEMQKEQMAATTTAQKNSLDFAAKQGELDIKRAQLTQ